MPDWFLRGDYVLTPVDYRLVALALLLAFICGHVVSWVYITTHSGISYSRSFVKSLVVMPILVALVLMVLSNNLVTAFGLMAILAIVRFRNVLRDTLDTAYVLGVIILGMACGAQRFSTAVVGCVILALVLGYLSLSAFGTRMRYGLIVNIQWERTAEELEDLGRLLKRHARQSQCASQRFHEGKPGAELSYRLMLRDPERSGDLLAELRAFPGVARATSIAAKDEEEP